MSKCDTCKHTPALGGDGWSACDGCIHDTELKDRYEPATNADHIRSMTDEELRVVLEILAKSDVCLNSQSAQCDGCVFSPFCNSVRCAEDVMDWLKQPYKEEV